MHQRAILRGILWLVFVVMATTGCSRSPTTQPAGAAEAKLNLYIWSEYIDPRIEKDFTAATGIEIRRDVYETTEDMMAKLQLAGGDRQYDVVVVADHAVPVLARLGLIRPLDAARTPNRSNIAERFLDPPYDPGCRYSLPYQWGTMGLIYRKDRIGRLDATWAVVFEPDRQPGPFILIDSMRDMFAAALKYQGRSINTRSPDDLRSAGELIMRAKKSPKSLGFEAGVGGKNRVVSGEAVMAIVYNGDAMRAIQEEPNLDFVLPQEGTLIWTDAMTMPSGAPHPDAAYRFINYILEADVGARLSNFNRYASPNRAALPKINPEDRGNPAIYPSEELLGRMELLQDLGADTRLYDEIWTAVKSR